MGRHDRGGTTLSQKTNLKVTTFVCFVAFRWCVRSRKPNDAGVTVIVVCASTGVLSCTATMTVMLLRPLFFLFPERKERRRKKAFLRSAIVWVTMLIALTMRMVTVTLGLHLLLYIRQSGVTLEAWMSSLEEKREPRDLSDKRDLRRGIHYHSKRHMQPENEPKIKRVTTQKPSRDLRKKPSGHLAPLEEDDMDNDEVISVAIGPPPIRPKYDKVHWKHPPKPSPSPNVNNGTATNLIKDILAELGRELISRQVSEDFIFGQYIGNSMRNMSANIKLKMQHEVLDLIVKYQKLNSGETVKPTEETPTSPSPLVVINNSLKDIKPEKKFIPANETEDTWPDFSNLKL